MPKWDAVFWNTLITVFMQNGLAEEAMKLFDRMPEQGVISWNAMISGYAQNGRFDKALENFNQMRVCGVKPHPDMFSNVLPTCANLAAL